jgi:hypothetical protein
VGVLPSSVRAIPESLAFTVTQAFPGLPMLLLCQEPLARDLVVLNDGRISLLAPPAKPERLAAQIRRHLAKRGVSAGPLFSRQHTRVIRGVKWWAAGISRHRYLRELGESVVFPWLRGDNSATQLTAIVPDKPGNLATGELAAWASTIAVAGDLAECHRDVPAWCSTAAALHADWAAGRCRLLGPAEGASAWILSPLRLPNAYRVGGQIGAEMAVLTPSFGDLFVLLSAPGEGAWAEGVFDQEQPGPVMEAAAQGGSVLLDFLQDALVQTAGDFAAVVLEVL